jgi:hypothetical protein
LFSLLLVDHQIVEGKNVVLIPHGAGIIGVDKFDHGSLLFCGKNLTPRPALRPVPLLFQTDDMEAKRILFRIGFLTTRTTSSKPRK